MSASPNGVARLMCPLHTACEKWTLTHTAVQSGPWCARETSWYDAIQVIKAADGKLAVTVDWEWFEQYRERLLAKQASGKKITPEIHQRHLLPDERLLTLVANTYGRKAGIGTSGRTI